MSICGIFKYLLITKIDKIETCERLFFSIAVPWQCFLLCCRLCGLRSSALLHTPHWPHQFSQPVQTTKYKFTATHFFHIIAKCFSLRSNQWLVIIPWWTRPWVRCSRPWFRRPRPSLRGSVGSNDEPMKKSQPCLTKKGALLGVQSPCDVREPEFSIRQLRIGLFEVGWK